MQVNPEQGAAQVAARWTAAVPWPRVRLIPVKARAAASRDAGAMAYLILLLVHLLAAIAFIGTVLVEVLFMPGVRRRLPPAAGRGLEAAFAAQARTVMPWVLLALFSAGLGLAWHHRGALVQPLGSHFALLLWLKIGLAGSVLGHFLRAMWLQRRGRLDGPRSHRLHLSVLGHVLAIAVLAKAMFHL